jgi:hypothetical protein
MAEMGFAKLAAKLAEVMAKYIKITFKESSRGISAS